MKPAKLISLIVLASVLVIASIYLFQPQQDKNIYGRALVLGFVENEIEDSTILNAWEKLDLTLELIYSCNNDNIDNASRCIENNINKSISRVRKNNKQLIILAEKNNANALLKLLHDNNLADVVSIILLEPDINKVLPSKYTNREPKLILLSELNNTQEKFIALQELSAQLRERNNWVWFTRLSGDTGGLLSHPVLPHMATFSVDGPVNPNYKKEFLAESQWQHPIVDNSSFWKHSQFVEQHEMSTDIKRILKAFYAHDLNYLKQWPLEKYHAFDLLKYRDSLPAEKQGRYVSFSNRKGHKFYLDLNKYGEYGPEFVIGIDNEDNLYRFTSFYITKRFYSWEGGGPKKDMLYAHSLGAFIHFRNSLPRKQELPYLQYSSILFDSISFSNDNPYENITGLSDEAFNVITLNCVPCHSVNGTGGAAHHLDYLTLKPQPGYAKPLQAYTKSVLENFFFNQAATAKLIGVNINYVDPEVGKELMLWLNPREN